jgi:hypothetical protein
MNPTGQSVCPPELGELRTVRAPGLIGAREAADRLVAGRAADTLGTARVVHLLCGDALAFGVVSLAAGLESA